ncbi:hypothetical protein PTSG_10346 [Salpingoeca rosetta]|uniref:Uncharacterized protein n=1 Tax=Salpingoeca rosetta (strain ATCC 50818 / BSB-021) TaxID=946362 RepID=F2UR17_SALR5|nr:uncharacterized protein PTSG_10346 [Salpingoeca rosetta]EGD80072.1 hypothetical protein PTSG_10346 [Salpingoeca rosetta]|eukprot:XP_004988397.1 hypothetical protein PTSG_10346 [Salpingoeca rosetta]
MTAADVTSSAAANMARSSIPSSARGLDKSTMDRTRIRANPFKVAVLPAVLLMQLVAAVVTTLLWAPRHLMALLVPTHDAPPPPQVPTPTLMVAPIPLADLLKQSPRAELVQKKDEPKRTPRPLHKLLPPHVLHPPSLRPVRARGRVQPTRLVPTKPHVCTCASRRRVAAAAAAAAAADAADGRGDSGVDRVDSVDGDRGRV